MFRLILFAERLRYGFGVKWERLRFVAATFRRVCFPGFLRGRPRLFLKSNAHEVRTFRVVGITLVGVHRHRAHGILVANDATGLLGVVSGNTK